MTASKATLELQRDFPPKQVALIRTTYQAISERGVHRVSLQDIADRAGVSKAVILYHFKTKDGLILRTMEWVLSRTAQRIHVAIDAAPSAREQVLAMVDVIFSGPDANRRFYLTYLDLLEHAAREDAFEELSATFRSIVNSLYGEVIRSGTADGSFRVGDIDEAATAMRAIVDGLFLLWLQETDWRRRHRRYKEICRRAVLTYLGAE